MMKVPHRTFYPDGTYEDGTAEAPDGYFATPPHTYTALELTQQDITDLQLSDIAQGQALTDLELMILGGHGNV